MNKTNSSRLENTELRRGKNYKSLGPEEKKAFLEAEARKRENTPTSIKLRASLEELQETYVDQCSFGFKVIPAFDRGRNYMTLGFTGLVPTSFWAQWTVFEYEKKLET